MAGGEEAEGIFCVAGGFSDDERQQPALYLTAEEVVPVD